MGHWRRLGIFVDFVMQFQVTCWIFMSWRNFFYRHCSIAISVIIGVGHKDDALDLS